MVCRLGVVAALGGGCPQVGVVCLPDVLLSLPAGQSALPRRWALFGAGNNDRWKILLWDVADAARSLGGRMLPLNLLWPVKGSLVIVTTGKFSNKLPIYSL
ncbi:hypothetical protein PAPYR_12762 [Paratrimastix pyriformis]|uniref:Uncharacterized protein n=1 Tax=Paratrimastix pyriformis TaxID=342808 RepID=A0ABQ8U7Y8_9EUKA|nr:hypothetical protein PAPYR_12762 [Paratrimastix pyriformis]